MAGPDTTTPEIWKPIPGYEGLYSVSDAGRVRMDVSRRNWSAGRIMSPATNRTGYRYVGLSKNGKRVWVEVHRLVALAFLGPCPTGHCVNHKSAVRTDNAVENLEYCTPAENTQHAIRHGSFQCGEQRGNAVLTADKVRDMRARHALGSTVKELAEEMHITPSLACRVLKRKVWKQVA